MPYASIFDKPSIRSQKERDARGPSRTSRAGNVESTSLLYKIVVAFFLIISVLLFVVTDGNPVLPLAPYVAIIGLAIFWFLPLRYSTLLVVFLTLLMHVPADVPMAGKWRGPLVPVGELLTDNLSHFGLGIPFQLVEFLWIFLALIAFLRDLQGNPIDRNHRLPTARIVIVSAYLTFGVMFFMTVWGFARGSGLREFMWQGRVFFMFPLVTMLFCRSFKTRDDFKIFIAMMVIICVIRIMEGTYFYWMIMRPNGYDLEYVMTHPDSVLFVATSALLILLMIEMYSWRTLLLNIVVQSIIFYGLVINDRRLAFVALAGCLLVMFFFIRREIQKRILKVCIAIFPLIPMYIAGGFVSENKIFVLVHKIRSTTDAKDPSNFYRDVENYNLVATIKKNPIIGSGFGHPFDEPVKLADISKGMAIYRYKAHDQFLWIWSVIGLVGSYAYWTNASLIVFLARRSYILTKDPLIRVMCVGSICIFVCVAFQAFGDMGATCVKGSMLLCYCLAATGNIAAQCGAWPSKVASRDRLPTWTSNANVNTAASVAAAAQNAAAQQARDARLGSRHRIESPWDSSQVVPHLTASFAVPDLSQIIPQAPVDMQQQQTANPQRSPVPRVADMPPVTPVFAAPIPQFIDEKDAQVRTPTDLRPAISVSQLPAIPLAQWPASPSLADEEPITDEPNTPLAPAFAPTSSSGVGASTKTASAAPIPRLADDDKNPFDDYPTDLRPLPDVSHLMPLSQIGKPPKDS